MTVGPPVEPCSFLPHLPHQPRGEPLLAAITSTQLIDQLVNGITLGMLYILVALGLNIILGLMGVINFSHGSFFMIGAYFMFTFVPIVGFFPAILGAALIVGLLGMAF